MAPLFNIQKQKSDVFLTMCKIIIFDLDGVLVNTRDLHYESLNLALKPHNLSISYDEHIAKYNGHPTRYKLDILTKEKNLSHKHHHSIWKEKQEYTQQLLKKHLAPNQAIINTIIELSKTHKIYVASNSIWKTVKNSLLYSGLLEYVDYFISCEDVKNPKPSSEIYLKCFQHANISPSDALIIEDSPIGIQAANNSGAHVLPVNSPDDVTLDTIQKMLSNIYSHTSVIVPKTKINIVIPMAGLGSRFASAGYEKPKPLIDVNGKTMIQTVVNNIGILGQYIFIVQKEHYKTYHLDILLPAIVPDCKIIQLDGLTEGAACSVLTCKSLIDNDTPLLIANSDQFLEWSPYQFLQCCSQNVDACISTFTNDSPKFSFAKVDDKGYVTEVAEKRPISNCATTGIYWWKQGSDFVKYAEQMISKNIRTNNEFYVCPVFNEAIQDSKRVMICHCDAFWCLGTPEDLEYYLEEHNTLQRQA